MNDCKRANNKIKKSISEIHSKFYVNIDDLKYSKIERLNIQDSRCLSLIFYYDFYITSYTAVE